MSDRQPKDSFEAHDILAAFSLLTRTPVPVDHERAGQRAAAATWAYPVVGGILGAVIGFLGLVLNWIGTPEGIAAAITLAAFAFATGAMHEDGLADCADGFGGAAVKDRRMEIMKDSRIGAFGAIALILVLLARWQGIAALPPVWLPLALMAVGAVSRVPMVLAMYAMPNARGRGLSASVGAPPAASVVAALVIAFAFCFTGLGLSAALVMGWALLGALPVFWLAHRLIGGQTGDVLGASQQCAEVAALAAAVAMLT